jgi:hypothetical protein
VAICGSGTSDAGDITGRNIRVDGGVARGV